MRLWNIATKDLQQLGRDWKTGLFTLIMPLGFTAAMGYAFRDVEDTPTVEVRVLALEGSGVVSAALERGLEETGKVKVEVEPWDEDREDAARDAVRRGRLAAAVWLPEGLDDAIARGVLPPLRTLADAAGGEGRAALGALEAELLQIESAAEAARALQGAGGASFESSFPEALRAFQAQPDVVDARRLQRPGSRPPSGFGQASPGLLVQFVILGLLLTATIVHVERRSGTWNRLLAAPLREWELVGGHGLAMFLLVLAQATLLILAGQLLFGVDYLHAPLGVALVVVSLAAWAAAMGLAIAMAAGKEEHVILLSQAAMFFFTGVGGCWFPLEGTGPTFRAIGGSLPSGLAMAGFQNIALRGLDSSSAIGPAAGILAWAAGFFVLAVVLLKRRRGG